MSERRAASSVYQSGKRNPDGQIVARALSAIGLPTRYRLGTGGQDPTARHPADACGRCDCSGYVAWSLGLPRLMRGDARLRAINGGRLSTAAMVACSADPGWILERVEAPAPGDVVVYARERPGGYGHCGIVVEVPAEWDRQEADCWRRLRVAHCNGSSSPDAIVVGAGSMWRRRGKILRLRPPAAPGEGQ